jgi:dephospho-CoA kinase
MLRVALTGGIATGKSYVLARLKDRGIATIDSDEIVHEALAPGTPASQAVATQIGSEFLKPDGGVDRTRLGAKVFKDPVVRATIEAIVHPIVYATIQEWFDAIEQPIGVASIPLLYETGHEKDFDFVVVTVCPPDVQLQRLVDRDRTSEEEARRRIAAQIPAEEKAARGDFVIRTGGAKAATDAQVDELMTVLLRR